MKTQILIFLFIFCYFKCIIYREGGGGGEWGLRQWIGMCARTFGKCVKI